MVFIRMKKEDGSFVYMKRHFPKREEARKPNPAFPKHRYKTDWTEELKFIFQQFIYII